MKRVFGLAVLAGLLTGGTYNVAGGKLALANDIITNAASITLGPTGVVSGTSANGLAALLYVPWLPHLRGKELGVIGFLYPLTAANAVKDWIRSLSGYVWASLGKIPALMLEEVSATFHGRDVFAPVAAHLAGGLGPDAVGPAVDPASLIRPETPEVEVEAWGLSGGGPVLESLAQAGVATRVFRHDAYLSPLAIACTASPAETVRASPGLHPTALGTLIGGGRNWCGSGR